MHERNDSMNVEIFDLSSARAPLRSEMMKLKHKAKLNKSVDDESNIDD